MEARLRYGPDALLRLRESLRAFGFGCLPEALAPQSLQALRREAEERCGRAVFAEGSEELRYRARIVSLGPQAADLLKGAEAAALLLAAFGEPVSLSENLSCQTLYQEGDHLTAHLDRPAEDCTVTILIYLAAVSPAPEAPGSGLQLQVYGGDPASGGRVSLTIPSRPGTLVLGRGSTVWHERPVLRPGERLIALTGCFAPTLPSPA